MTHSAVSCEYIHVAPAGFLTETVDRDRYKTAGAEPLLADVLCDPIVHLVMKRDGVTFDELVGILERLQGHLDASEIPGAACDGARVVGFAGRIGIDRSTN